MDRTRHMVLERARVSDQSPDVENPWDCLPVGSVRKHPVGSPTGGYDSYVRRSFNRDGQPCMYALRHVIPVKPSFSIDARNTHKHVIGSRF